MSSATIMDSFDAPMLDYSGDSDVHMHTTVSSPKPWSQSETIMEEDVHPIHFPNPFPSHPPQQDVEIDMDDYYNENVEYEMADGEVVVPDTELVDVDVYDAPREEAFLASAPVSHSTDLTTQNPEPRKSAANHFAPSDIGVSTDHIPAVSNPEPLLPKSAEPEPLTPTLPQETVVQDHDINSSQDTAAITLQTGAPPLQVGLEDPLSGGVASAALEGRADLSAGVDSTPHKVDTSQPLDDPEQKNGPESSPTEHESSASVPQDVTPRADVEELPHQAETREDEPHEGVRVHHEGHESGVPEAALDSTETGEPPRYVTECHEAEGDDNDDPHEISEGVYIEPPPPVLIELPSPLDQSICTLFNTPAHLPSDDTERNASSTAASYIVLLQNRPTLYYETLNDVFDALREEERIQFMTEFIDREMVLDAHDLELVVSEDNVHAREISLHDLNVLHDGLGLTGPLRLRLRTVLSRFICRYRSLQSQVTRLRVSETTNHPADDSNENERAYVAPPPEPDSGYYQVLKDDRQTKREPTNDGEHEGLTKGNVDEPEDVESTDYAHADYQDEHEEETYGESEQYADAREYLQVLEEEADTQEETDQPVANDESEFVLDADPGSTFPETTEYQERDEEHGEDGVSADVEAPNTTTASTSTKETVFPSSKLGVLTDVPESAATGEDPQPEDSEESRALDAELSSADGVYEDEETEADGLTEDAEAEDDTAGDASARPIDNLPDATNEEQDAAGHENVNFDAQEVELATSAVSLGDEISESVNVDHEPEEDDENAESWELDDGYAAWDETFEGDELDIAPAGEPDSVSSDSSTLSGKTASISSKRSFAEVDPTVAQSSLQNPKKTRTR